MGNLHLEFTNADQSDVNIPEPRQTSRDHQALNPNEVKKVQEIEKVGAEQDQFSEKEDEFDFLNLSDPATMEDKMATGEFDEHIRGQQTQETV